MNILRHHHCRGGALLVALIVALGVAVALMATTDHWIGAQKVGRVLLARQKAANAAEAATALVESKLMTQTFEQLRVPIENQTSVWWSLKGCCYTDASTSSYVPADSGLWINGCLVRWRIEPLLVYGSTLSGTGSATDTTAFINPPTSTDLDTWRASLATSRGTIPSGVSNPQDVGYHFRVIAESYALRDPMRGDGTPWARRSGHSEDEYIVRAVATRIIQIKPQSLFKYALIHLGDAPDADLDLQCGGGIKIYGDASYNVRVHTNGVLTATGGLSSGYYASNPHQMASGDGSSTQQQTIFGPTSTDKPVLITAVGGFLRTGKEAAYYAYVTNQLPSGMTVDPTATVPIDLMSIPIDTNAADNNYSLNRTNLNADATDSQRIKINGKYLTMQNDSRSPNQMTATFGNYLLDGNTGAVKVTGLADFPDLGQYPMEHQVLQLDKSDSNLYVKSAGIFTSSSGLGSQVYYSVQPTLGISAAASAIPANLSSGSGSARVPLNAAKDWTTLTMQPLNATSALLPSGWTIQTAPTKYPVSSTGLPVWYTDSTQSGVPTSSSVSSGVASPSTNFDSGTPSAITSSERSDAGFYPYEYASGGASSGAHCTITTVCSSSNDKVVIDSSEVIGTGFSRYEKKGYYLSRALFDNGQDDTSDPTAQYYGFGSSYYSVKPDFLTKTGLVIRELPHQRYVEWATSVSGTTMTHTLTIRNDAASNHLTATAANGKTYNDPITWPNGRTFGIDYASYLVSGVRDAYEETPYTGGVLTSPNTQPFPVSGVQVKAMYDDVDLTPSNQAGVSLTNLGITYTYTIGSDGGGAYGGTGNTASKVFDGDFSTYYDPAKNVDNAYVYVAFTEAMAVSYFSYSPRSGQEARMVGAVFQGTNMDPTNSSCVWTTLHTVGAQPTYGKYTYGWSNDTVSKYQYYRYAGGTGGSSRWVNISELHLMVQPRLLNDYTVRPTRYPSQKQSGNTGANGADYAQPTSSSVETALHLVPNARDRIAMVRYLCSQYNVLFMGRNITAAFFSQLLNAANYDDMIVTEDSFCDIRENNCLEAMYGSADTYSDHGGVVKQFNAQDAWLRNDTGYLAGDGLRTNATQDTSDYWNSTRPNNSHRVGSTSLRQNCLTVNLWGLMQWLKYTPVNSFGNGFSGMTTNAHNYFNGLMYVHRTRRSWTYHPVFCPQFAWMMPVSDMTQIQAAVTSSSTYPFLRNFLFAHDFNTNPLDTSSYYPQYPVGGAWRNYPNNWREASGPEDTFSGCVRIKGGIIDDQGPSSFASNIYNTASNNARQTRADVDWGHDPGNDGVDDNMTLGTSGFTFVTPNRLYVWGDFNTKTHADTGGSTGLTTPCAIWCDSITRLSPNWRDVYHSEQSMYNYGKGLFFTYAGAGMTVNSSVVMNHVPVNLLNALSMGGSTYESFFKALENWPDSGPFNFKGSMVLMGPSRYTHAPMSFAGTTSFPLLNRGRPTFYSAYYTLSFNTDLFKTAGQPPFSPMGVEAKRVMSHLDVYDH